MEVKVFGCTVKALATARSAVARKKRMVAVYVCMRKLVDVCL